jgi:hypothetical protein
LFSTTTAGRALASFGRQARDDVHRAAGGKATERWDRLDGIAARRQGDREAKKARLSEIFSSFRVTGGAIASLSVDVDMPLALIAIAPSLGSLAGPRRGCRGADVVSHAGEVELGVGPQLARLLRLLAAVGAVEAAASTGCRRVVVDDRHRVEAPARRVSISPM